VKDKGGKRERQRFPRREPSLSIPFLLPFFFHFLYPQKAKEKKVQGTIKCCIFHASRDQSFPPEAFHYGYSLLMREEDWKLFQL